MYIYRFLIATIIIIILQTILFSKFSNKKIVYRRYFNKDYLFEGEYVNMIEEIHNNKILPVPWIKIESQINESLVFSGSENLQIRHEGLHESLFSLPPYSKITRIHDVSCMHRGIFDLSNVYITSGTLLGGGENTIESPTNSILAVFPRVGNLKDLPVLHHNIFGEFIMKRWILKDPFIISGTNEYTYSEPLKLINWKATAKADSLRVHNLDFSSDHKIMILLNVDLSEDQWKENLEPDVVEPLISIAATFAYESIKMGIETGFATNAGKGFNDGIDIIRPKSGSDQILKILYAMSEMKHRRNLSFHTFLKNEVESNIKNCDYIIISWYKSAELTQYIDMLEKQGNSVMFLSKNELNIHMKG